jgi:hypothetical protein
MRLRTAGLLMAGGLLFSVAPAGGATGRTITLAYTAELRGNLVPCACPARPLGGLARRIGWVDSLRSATAGPVFVVDAGSSEEPLGGYPFVPPAERVGLQTLLEAADREMAYDASVGASRDAASLQANEARRVVRDGVAVGFVAVDERTDPTPAGKAVRALGRVDLVVLLCSGDFSFATTAAGIVRADIAVVARGAKYTAPIWQDGVLFLGPGVDGKYVGLARVTDGKPVRALDVRLRSMDATVPSSPAWEERVETALVGLEARHPGALSRGE